MSIARPQFGVTEHGFGLWVVRDTQSIFSTGGRKLFRATRNVCPTMDPIMRRLAKGHVSVGVSTGHLHRAKQIQLGIPRLVNYRLDGVKVYVAGITRRIRNPAMWGLLCPTGMDPTSAKGPSGDPRHAVPQRILLLAPPV